MTLFGWLFDRPSHRRLDDDALSSIAVRLAVSFPEWVDRRVEHVEFLDDTTVRRRQSISVRWPTPDFFVEEARPKAGDVIYVPLDVLRKRPLIEVDVALADGSTFPVLSTRRNSEVAASGLTAVIWSLSEQQHLGGLTSSAVQLIEQIVRAPAREGASLVKALDDPSTELGRVLHQPDELRGLLRELSTSFLLLAPLVYEPGGQTVLKFAYSQPLPWTFSARNVAARLGLADFRSTIDRLNLGYADSYHLEVDAPNDIRLSRARLIGSYVDAAGAARLTLAIAQDGDSPVVDLHAKRPPQELLTKSLHTTSDRYGSGRCSAAPARWRRVQLLLGQGRRLQQTPRALTGQVPNCGSAHGHPGRCLSRSRRRSSRACCSSVPATGWPK